MQSMKDIIDTEAEF